MDTILYSTYRNIFNLIFRVTVFNFKLELLARNEITIDHVFLPLCMGTSVVEILEKCQKSSNKFLCSVAHYFR